MSSLTSANSSLAIAVTGLYNNAQAMNGFSEGDAYSVDAVDVTETLMGVDGILSGGYIPQKKTMSITLQADSSSIPFFESWYAAQEAAQDVFIGNGIIMQPAVGKKYVLTRGFLKNYTPIADAKNILQPRKFSIEWNAVVPVPL